MNGRKIVAGISVLCALAFCALGAASASAAPTTAGECVSGGGKKDFSDAHCDKAVTAGTGSFGHVLFANGVETKVTATNDLTGTASNFLLEGKLAGITTVIECTSASAKGTVTNSAGGVVTFGNSTTSFTGCTVQAPVVCKGTAATVATTNAKETGPHNLGVTTGTDTKTGPTNEVINYHKEGAGTEMGLKFEPPGTEFTKITVSCPVEGTFEVTGFAYATPGRGGAASSSGATGVFTKSSTIGGLKFAGNPATLEGTLTFRKEGGNPLILTTTE